MSGPGFLPLPHRIALVFLPLVRGVRSFWHWSGRGIIFSTLGQRKQNVLSMVEGLDFLSLVPLVRVDFPDLLSGGHFFFILHPCLARSAFPGIILGLPYYIIIMYYSE